MTGKQLKNSILQWAIQGKLVPQDPNDEPASVLLERIRAEKARLVKEKKIKRDKNESIIYRGKDNSYYEKMADGTVRCIDSEIPFAIPDSWAWCRLRDICSMQAGKNIKSTEISKVRNENYRFRCVGGNGLRGYTSNYNHEGNHAIVGRQGALCGCLNRENGKFYATEHAVVVDTFNILSDAFMYYFLTALNLNQYATATAQPGLAVSTIIEVLCPLPPLPEQHRIIATIEAITPLITIYQDNQKRLNTLNTSISLLFKKSILQEAIQGRLVPQIESEGTAEQLLAEIAEEKKRLVKEGKLKKSALTASRIFRGDDNRYYEQIGSQTEEIEVIINLPSSWSVCRLRDLCQLTDGEKSSGSYPCLDVKYLRGKSPGTPLTKGKLVHYGDNIILVDGENSGEVFTVPCDGYMGSTFKQLWISKQVDKDFVLLIILFYKSMLRNSKKGAAIPHLNKELFYNIIVGLPPFQEQQRIVAECNLLFDTLK